MYSFLNTKKRPKTKKKQKKKEKMTILQRSPAKADDRGNLAARVRRFAPIAVVVLVMVAVFATGAHRQTSGPSFTCSEASLWGAQATSLLVSAASRNRFLPSACLDDLKTAVRLGLSAASRNELRFALTIQRFNDSTL